MSTHRIGMESKGKELSFLLFTIIFLLTGMLGVAKSFVHAGLNVPNALILVTDGNELFVGFFMRLLKLVVLLIQNSAVVLAVGEHIKHLSPCSVITLQFFFVLGLVFRLCLVELDFLQTVHYRLQLLQDGNVFGHFTHFFDGYYHLYFDAPDTIYGLDATIRDVLDLDYSQFQAAIEFLYPEAEFSTEHGVKGEEYDNVVFVISKGWNQYQFETYAPMITGHTPIPNGKQTSYERNRNLFYVCCSRPRKRLFFFVSVPIDATFRAFLVDLVGAENIYTYSQYLESKQ